MAIVLRYNIFLDKDKNSTELEGNLIVFEDQGECVAAANSSIWE